jgi:hypothetical protein
VQDLDGGLYPDLGEWQQLKLHGFRLNLLLIVVTYKSPNAVFQLDGHPILMIFCCVRKSAA